MVLKGHEHFSCAARRARTFHASPRVPRACYFLTKSGHVCMAFGMEQNIYNTSLL